MTSAILDDIASLVAVAILVPLATGESDISALSVLTVIGKAIAFFCFIVLLELLIFPHDSKLSLFHKIPILRNYGVRQFISFGDGSQSALAVLLIALVISIIAFQFGFHPAVGAYMAGLIVKQDYFQFRDPSEVENAKVDRYNQTREVVDSVAFSWIGPVFFVELGTKIVLDASILVNVIPQVITLTIAIFLVQIFSASMAARFTGSYAWHESILIGLGMLGRAELAFVVMDIGYVQNSILTTDAFYTLMVTAFMLNVAVPISIRLWKPYFEGSKTLKIKLGGKQYCLSKENA
jgi:Kef-type K+ transport system membrane component KefB